MTEIEQKAARYDAIREIELMSDDDQDGVMKLYSADGDTSTEHEFDCDADALIAALAEYHALQTQQERLLAQHILGDLNA